MSLLAWSLYFTGICHSVNGGGAAPRGEGACSWGVWCLLPGGCLLLGGGVCFWGVPAPRGWRGCPVETPPTATAAGVTHPTGMHSFLKFFYESVQLTTIIIVIIVITIGCRQETDFIDVILFSQVYFIPEPIMIETPGTQIFGFLKNKYIRVFWIFHFTEVCSGTDSFPTVLGKGPCEYQKSRIA